MGTVYSFWKPVGPFIIRKVAQLSLTACHCFPIYCLLSLFSFGEFMCVFMSIAGAISHTLAPAIVYCFDL